MTRDYKTLDAIVVVACLAMVGTFGAALVFLEVPEPNLPILSALVSGTAGAILGAYSGARWGNKKTDDPPDA